MSSSPPFTHDSPAPRRQIRTLGPPAALGFTTSTSEGSLSTHATTSRVLPPSLPSRIKPFLLRAVTPDRKKNRPLSLEGLAGASGPTYRNATGSTGGTAKAFGVNGVGAEVKRTMSRSSLVRGRIGGAGRESKVVMMGYQVRDRANSILEAHSGSGRTQTEEVKGRMKLEALEARKEREEGRDAGSVRGKRWLAQLVGRKVEGSGELKKGGSLRDMTNGRQAAATTSTTTTDQIKVLPIVTIESPSPPATLQSRIITTPTRTTSTLNLRGPTVVPAPRASITYVPPTSTSTSTAPPTTPIKSTASRRQLGVRPRPVPVDDPIEGAAASYSSLQDMLESSGFADTRVVTPIQLPPTNVLPAQTFPLPRDLKSRPSLLSLFAIWSPRAPLPSPHTSPALSRPASVGSSSGTVNGVNTPQANTSPSPTITIRNTRALQWIEEVARTTAPPPLPPYVPRTSPPVSRVVPVASREREREPSRTRERETRGKEGMKTKTLRHVVSDPTLSLTNAVGNRYGSFALPLDGDVPPSGHGAHRTNANPTPMSRHPTTTRVRTRTKTTPISTPTPEPWSSWTTLRTRASSALLGSLYTSGVADELRRREQAEREEKEKKELPKLLRKAVSSAVLRPVLTTEGAARM